MTNSQITCNCIKLKDFPQRLGTKTRMPILTTFVQHSIGSPNHSNQKVK